MSHKYKRATWSSHVAILAVFLRSKSKCDLNKTFDQTIQHINISPIPFTPSHPQPFLFPKMSKLLLTLLPSLALVLLLTFLSFNFHPKILENSSKTPRSIHVYKHVQIAESACEGTLYSDLCVSTVAALPELRRKTLPEVISHTVNVTMKEVRDSASNCSSIRRKLLKKLEPLELRALEDCLELFSDTIAELKKILTDLTASSSPEKYYDDLQTLLSGAMTNQYTCLDGFAYSKNNTRRFIEGRLKRISRHVSNSLAMVKKLKRKSKKHTVAGEEFPEYGKMRNGFPKWLKKNDRRLLQTAVNQTKFDLIVAKDGSGNFTTINEALSAAPNNSNTRFVIYIKTGAYYEYIEVERRKPMIMFLGDGIGKTLIKGNRSVVDGWTTFRSSTVGQFNFFTVYPITIYFYLIIFSMNCMSVYRIVDPFMHQLNLNCIIANKFIAQLTESRSRFCLN